MPTTLRSGDLRLRLVGEVEPARFEVADGERPAGVLVLSRMPQQPSVVTLSWSLPDLDAAVLSEAIRLATEYAFTGLAAHRVDTTVAADDQVAAHAAARAGLRQEGVLRGQGVGAQGEPRDAVLFGRLRDDAGTENSEAFTHVLNSTLPRKRLIAQALIRDEHDRILLCELTYKRFWDLPGGVVDPDEPPAFAVEREIREELGLGSTASRLATVAWLPRWLGWDDATLLVFEVELTDGLGGAVLLPREIKAIHWVSPDDLGAHVAPYTVEVVRAAIRALDEGAGANYFEAGPRPT